MVLRYLSDLQAKIARLEQNPTYESGASQARMTANNRTAQARDRSSPAADDERPPANPSSFEGTRDNSPIPRPDPDEANLMNPLIESSKFMSSSSGRPCKLLVYA